MLKYLIISLINGGLKMMIDCNKCDISIYRNHIVNGSGNKNSDLMFIGEAPGYKEDKSGVPFVGNSGNLLNNMLHLMGLDRTMVYITNIIKCRPSSNRTPNAIEISNCRNHLDNELNTVNPKVIVLLGGVALNSYFKTSGLNIGSTRGKIIPYKNKYIIITYHPSYILRNSTSRNLNIYNRDFKLISDVYKTIINPAITTNF